MRPIIVSGGPLYCPACSVSIAMVEGALKRVEVTWKDPTDPEYDVVEKHDVTIGARVTLERGFVNAKRRHPSGEPWYWRGRSVNSRPLVIRIPAIVSCRCGQEIRIAGTDATTQAYAEASAGERASHLEAQLLDDAGDRWLQQGIDLARGK